jgi:hypothetical protein
VIARQIGIAMSSAVLLLFQVQFSMSSTNQNCSLATAEGYTCSPGYCANEAHPKAPAPVCQGFVELKLGGKTAEKVANTKAWCDRNGSSCSGFAVDPSFPITLAFTGGNFTEVQCSRNQF